MDVRSPGEFEHAHIPKAFSFPLFTDEERKVVGTAYKQRGRQPAIKIGLEYFGPKMVKMVENANAIAASFYGDAITPAPVMLVHCWRGGMRSAAIAWLLDLYGFKVYLLADGYKAFRNWVLKQFEKNYDLVVVGGFTGSNKTAVLQQLEAKGENIIDLEKIALHKGSAFGGFGIDEKPTQEMFENQLALALSEKSGNDQPIYVEDESRRIGVVNIPLALFEQMRNRQVLFLDIPFEERLQLIVKDYGVCSKEYLLTGIERIQKRLGGLETKTAINFLKEDNLAECFRILLMYYDKCYIKGLNSRPSSCVRTKITTNTTDALVNANVVLQQMKLAHE